MLLFDSIMKVTSWALRKLAAFWKAIVGWLKKAYAKIKQVLSKAPEGVRTFLKKVGGAFRNVSRNYVENEATGEWTCVEYTMPANENEIPEAIRAKARALNAGSELETTDRLEYELSSI